MLVHLHQCMHGNLYLALGSYVVSRWGSSQAMLAPFTLSQSTFSLALDPRLRRSIVSTHPSCDTSRRLVALMRPIDGPCVGEVIFSGCGLPLADRAFA